MISVDVVLRALTLLLHIVRRLYWDWLGKKEFQKGPDKISFEKKLHYFSIDVLIILIVLQLLGLDILPFPHNSYVQAIGFIIALIGVIIGIAARRELGTSWKHAVEYQVQKDQKLITTGIYRYIRHPIYIGLLLLYIGSELVVESYLAFFFLVFLGYKGYMQCKKEEMLLLKHFGKKYEDYKKKSKMFIPGVF